MSKGEGSPSTPVRDYSQLVKRVYAAVLRAISAHGQWQFYDRQIGEAQREAFAEIVANAVSMAEQLAPVSETSSSDVPKLVGRILKPGEKAESPEFIKGMVYAASLYEQVNSASDFERQRGDPGAGAMGAVLEFRDLIRKEAGHG